MVRDPKGNNQDMNRGSRLLSPTQAAERGQVNKRLMWAIPIALGLIVIIALLGPSAEDVERKFTVYGTDGPLELMPEIAVEDGIDMTQRSAQSMESSPPPAPIYETEPEPQPDTKTIAPQEELTSPVKPADGTSQELAVEEAIVSDSEGQSNVDMLMPSQSANSDFIIRKLVRPVYPPGASKVDRMKRVLAVKAGFFVNETGSIVAVMIQSNEGGNEFGTAVKAAMEQWEFEPRIRNGEPPASRWLVVTWRFRSPFAGATLD